MARSGLVADENGYREAVDFLGSQKACKPEDGDLRIDNLTNRPVCGSVVEGKLHGDERVLLELDVKALQRLLRCKSLSIDEFRSVNHVGKQCVQGLYLDLLNRKLSALPNTLPNKSGRFS